MWTKLFCCRNRWTSWSKLLLGFSILAVTGPCCLGASVHALCFLILLLHTTFCVLMYKILSTPAWRWKACTSNPYRTGLIHLYSVSSNRAEQQEQIVTQDIAEYLWDSGLHYTQSTKPLQSSLCLAACSQRNPFAEGGGGERLIVSASTNHVLSSAALTIHLQHNIALK